MRGIFISYRRDDAEGQAGRLFDDLAAHFGRDAVFMDVAGIKKGLDFRRVIDQHVGSCGVLLVIIGKRWTSAVDADGKRRLDDANDFVRLETAAALNRDIPVIPVLVQGAVMPRDHELPDALKELAFRNGTELTHARWDSDVELLIEDLKPYVELSGSATTTTATPVPSAPPALPATAAPTTGSGKSRTTWIALVVAALLIGAGGFGYSAWRDRATQEQARIADEKRKADEVAAAQKETEDKRQRDEADRVAAQKAAEEQQRKLDADRAARAAADKAAADKAAADRAAAERAAARAAADRAAAEKAAADRAAADKAAAEKAAAEKAAADRAAAEKAAADRAAADKAAADRAAAEKAAADRAAAERAAADRAAAARAGTCLSGYVWREAIPTDRVCVTPATRDQVASDNRQAAARRQPGGGAYGPNTCRQGYVWREAYPGDVVCVTPDVRSATARDNAAASSRVVTTTDRVRSSVPSSRAIAN